MTPKAPIELTLTPTQAMTLCEHFASSQTTQMAFKPGGAVAPATAETIEIRINLQVQSTREEVEAAVADLKDQFLLTD